MNSGRISELESPPRARRQPDRTAVRGQQFDIHQGQPASGQCPLGGPHRREERGQCRNATFAGRRADIHRRFDTQTPDTAVDGVL